MASAPHPCDVAAIRIVTVGDPRGVDRVIIDLHSATHGTYLTLSCNHVAQVNQVFSYRIGDRERCMGCSECRACGHPRDAHRPE
jgi:hypothetical protein